MASDCCYFCHAPVIARGNRYEIVKISLFEVEHVNGSVIRWTEYAHRECLEQAAKLWEPKTAGGAA